MKLKFVGSLEHLKLEVYRRCNSGRWQEGKNGVHTFRASDGAVLHFSTTKGTVWFQGSWEEAQNMQSELEPLLIAGLI
jgi:hypothetical protein